VYLQGKPVFDGQTPVPTKKSRTQRVYAHCIRDEKESVVPPGFKGTKAPCAYHGPQADAPITEGEPLFPTQAPFWAAALREKDNPWPLRASAAPKLAPSASSLVPVGKRLLVPGRPFVCRYSAGIPSF